MEFYELFYDWVPKWVRLSFLTLTYTLLLIANGVYPGNIIAASSNLGVYTEPYIASYNAVYIGIALGFLISFRIRSRFTNKGLLLFSLVMLLLTNVVCTSTNSPELTVLTCLVLGATKVPGVVELFFRWLNIWSKNQDTSKLYPFVYFSALGGIYANAWLTAQIAYRYDWRYANIILLVLILFSIIGTILFAEAHPLKHKVPLYQMDWTGLVLLASACMLLNYVIVYSKVEDGLVSDKIKAAIFVLTICFLLFIKRELRLKRPLLDLNFFKLPSFRLGLFLFFLIGIFTPLTLQNTFTFSGLKYENISTWEVALFMIPGIFAGATICYYWYYRSYSPHLLIIIGFSLGVCHYAIMYHNYGVNFAMQQFWVPSILKGMSLSILFTSIGLYFTHGHTLPNVLAVVGAGILIRSFLGTGVFTSIYTYFLYAQKIRHLEYLSGLIDANVFQSDKFQAPGVYTDTIQLQASLNAAKEITGDMVILGILIIIFLTIRLLYLYNKRLRPFHTVQIWD
ncbi:MFS family permease [Mucilaginibacter sp. SG538B]|uniref:hypothetical protein n=1 Tax=Mucilaginibacter sp. SG538B TaxID=2587021 RepID=UPI00159E921A|nr:hypothetical protein [Mucilaginibacter sp. SG538B]NVM66741.1 MFS family permease [Mucilaginibacter sp. SG538B]